MLLFMCFRWQPWIGRFYISGALVGSAVMSVTLEQRKRLSPLLAPPLALLAVFNFVCSSRELTYYSFARIALAAQPYCEQPGLLGVNYQGLYRHLDQLLPPKARVLLFLGIDDWDYPLFGKPLSRTLISAYDDRMFGQPKLRTDIKASDYDYVLAMHNFPPALIHQPPLKTVFSCPLGENRPRIWLLKKY
jgi:hypothetical protein